MLKINPFSTLFDYKLPTSNSHSQSAVTQPKNTTNTLKSKSHQINSSCPQRLLTTPPSRLAMTSFVERPTLNFDSQGRARVENPLDKNRIQPIFEGGVRSEAVNDIFFPKTPNWQSIFIFEAVVSLLLGNNEVSFQVCPSEKKCYINFQGQKHDFYEIMSKVKWDLLDIDSEMLDFYNNKNSLNWAEPPKNSSKAYLYDSLHCLEKKAICEYTVKGSIINRFLRNTQYYESVTPSYLAECLCLVAVMCSGLNKIGVSSDVLSSSFVYRCLVDSERSIGGSNLDYHLNQLRTCEKIKEHGFTGLSFHRPMKSFLNPSKYVSDFMKIYPLADANIRGIVKDISGLSRFRNENECLLLPNTKERIIRNITMKKIVPEFPTQFGVQAADDEETFFKERSVFICKPISKRQRVL